ncbi:MAG: hypothetical protein JNM34_02785 [Chthonomonadaceae bacterium]|nr:hypothetical protein [Chthonomonadaceae bacterium]
MPQSSSRFEWPEVHETTTYALVASRVFDHFLDGKRRHNDQIWADDSKWKLGFYFGAGDSRLWVPVRRNRDNKRKSELVVNFGHPLGKRAFRILCLAYSIGFLAVGMIIAAMFGARW